MERSEKQSNIIAAILKVQSALKPVSKDADNPYYKSKYADLNMVWESIRKLITDNGLCVIQSAEGDENGNILVTTLLVHSSLEWISSTLKSKPVQDTPAGAGSTIKYLRRYGLEGLLGITTANDPEDDDGNTASGTTTTQESKFKVPRKSPAVNKTLPSAPGNAPLPPKPVNPTPQTPAEVAKTSGNVPPVVKTPAAKPITPPVVENKANTENKPAAESTPANDQANAKATPEQVKIVTALFAEKQPNSTIRETWFKQLKVKSWEEMNQASITKIIKYLETLKEVV